MSQKTGVISVVAANTIFGLNAVFCKHLTQSVDPAALFTIRALGTAALFWIISLFVGQDKTMKGKEIALAALAALIGIYIPQSSIFFALPLSTPFDASMVGTLKPLFTIFIAFLIFGQKVSLRGGIGTLVALAGAVLLVIFSKKAGAFGTTPVGLVWLFVNAVSISFYFVLFKPFIQRHNPVTLMKWMWTFSLLFSIPLSVRPLTEFSVSVLDMQCVLEISFLILIASVLAFFLVPIGQKNLSPAQYSVFSYVQPIVASIVGTMMGLEHITPGKILAAALMIVGLYLANADKRKIVKKL